MERIYVVRKEEVDHLVELYEERNKYFEYSPTWTKYDQEIEKQLAFINKTVLEIDA